VSLAQIRIAGHDVVMKMCLVSLACFLRENRVLLSIFFDAPPETGSLTLEVALRPAGLIDDPGRIGGRWAKWRQNVLK
jgi:hypothetical protein